MLKTLRVGPATHEVSGSPVISKGTTSFTDTSRVGRVGSLSRIQTVSRVTFLDKCHWSRDLDRQNVYS